MFRRGGPDVQFAFAVDRFMNIPGFWLNSAGV